MAPIAYEDDRRIVLGDHGVDRGDVGRPGKARLWIPGGVDRKCDVARRSSAASCHRRDGYRCIVRRRRSVDHSQRLARYGRGAQRGVESCQGDKERVALTCRSRGCTVPNGFADSRSAPDANTTTFDAVRTRTREEMG